MPIKKLNLLRVITSSNYLYNFSSSYSLKSLTASYLNTISQSLIPAKNNTYTLGSPTKKWKDIYVSTASIYFDGYPLRVSITNNTPSLNFFSSSIVTVPVGSSTSTASYSNKSLTASYALKAGQGGTSLRTGSSYPITSSYANRAITASYALNVSTGTSGTAGSSGQSGAAGASGTSGTSATAGSSGQSGAAGTSGTSATAGSSGQSGATGAAGTSGTSATAGSSGQSGATGTSGTSGGGASLTTGSLYPITSSWSRRSLTASYALNAGGGSSLAGAQTFISNGSQTIYTLNQSVVNRDQILVVTNGVVQSRTGSNYTVSGTTLTLSEAVQSGGLVDVRYINAGQGTSGTSGINGTTQTGSIAKQIIWTNVKSGSSNTITGLNLSGNKWNVNVIEEWNSGSIVGDQYYNNTSLLLHFSGSNNSTTFKDNSSNNFTVTPSGAIISTAQNKFGGSSGYFNGGYYLSLPSNTAFAFGTSDFTVECWLYPTTTPSDYAVWYTTRGSDASSIFFGFLNGTTTPILYSGGVLLQSSVSLTTNTWSHVCISRYGTSLKMFVNGIERASATNSSNFSATSCYIGKDISSGMYAYTGYIDELRVTKGVARYTGNFTTQSAEFANYGTITQYATKYIGLVGGLNDKSVDYGVQKLNDTSLKIVKMSTPSAPYPSGSLSASIDRVYVNVLDYSTVSVTSSYARNSLTASYALNASSGGVTSGKVFAMTLLFS